MLIANIPMICLLYGHYCMENISDPCSEIDIILRIGQGSITNHLLFQLQFLKLPQTEVPFYREFPQKGNLIKSTSAVH